MEESKKMLNFMPLVIMGKWYSPWSMSDSFQNQDILKGVAFRNSDNSFAYLAALLWPQLRKP
jgi:hypothetical protein